MTFCVNRFSFLLAIDLGVELLDLIVTVFKNFRNCPAVFKNGCTTLQFQQQSCLFSNLLKLIQPVFFVVCS